jgi:hypothetical protein
MSPKLQDVETVSTKDNVIPFPVRNQQRRRHEWGPSRVGHGEAQCIHCLMTNREAWVLGDFCPDKGR